MNFKDAYKSMTDEIQPDEKLLARILNGDKKNRKHFVLPVKSVYTAALAAMFIIVAGTVYFKSGIDSHMPAGESVTQYEKEAPSAQVSEKYIVAEKSGGEISDNISTPKDTCISDAATPSASEKKEASNETVSDESRLRAGGGQTDKQQDSQALNLYEPEKKEEMASDESEAKEESLESYDMAFVESQDETQSSKVTSGGGGGGSSSAAVGIMVQTLDISGYWEYIGFDVTSRMTLPHNMKFFVPHSASVKSNGGEVFQDVLSISAASPDGAYSLYLTISKIQPQSGSVSVTVDGVHMGICSDTLSEKEMSDILSSIR